VAYHSAGFFLEDAVKSFKLDVMILVDFDKSFKVLTMVIIGFSDASVPR
jgi:hypothetical protein